MATSKVCPGKKDKMLHTAHSTKTEISTNKFLKKVSHRPITFYLLIRSVKLYIYLPTLSIGRLKNFLETTVHKMKQKAGSIRYDNRILPVKLLSFAY